MTEFAEKIVNKAVSLNFEKCGIIGVDAMKGYGEKLANRIERFPETEKMLRNFAHFADPRQKFPWAKSVVICSWRVGVYRIPYNLNGLIGKHYLVDGRRNKAADAYRGNMLLEKYMTDELHMHAASAHDSGITSCRWAAMSAGIGSIRKNNFFYGDHGSYYALSAFLIDQDLEYIHTPTHKPCSDSCNLCVKNCPTRSLAEPYAMCSFACVSYLTNKCYDNGAFAPLSSEIGGWIYGCDVCQDVCPHNKGEWLGDRDFPGLDELAGEISPEKVVMMDYEYLRNVISPKFWYIAPDDVWVWKRNALNAMRNGRDKRYEAAIISACSDEDGRVRAIAEDMKNGSGKNAERK
ncbi:Fe-S oxidoreductase [Synergistales bacterium]|nr:Fe-S oxidoreductase [Synergistales bacterium]